MAHTSRAIGALLLLLTGAQMPATAPDENRVLKVPRFVSLHSDKVNLRTGPGRQYPIEWVLTRRDMPVEVVAQFDHWRRVREWDGTVGWVQEHMVDDKRFVVIEKGADRQLRAQPQPSATVVALAEPGAIARLSECEGPWCRIETRAVTGWVPRGDLWGVYSDEMVP